MFGASWIVRAACITISPGSATWAPQFLRNKPRFLPSSPRPGTARLRPSSSNPCLLDAPSKGWQVDQEAREVIRKAGFAKHFVHRTGHNIGQEVHGNGANMDSLETHDDRRILPQTCFSIEPGIYLPEFGVRSEVDVYIDGAQVRVTGPMQTGILPLLG